MNRAPDLAHELAAMERELEASILRDDFGSFVEAFWSTVSARPYSPNTATTAIIATLAAVASGRIRRLLIEVPPGTGKTTILALYAAFRLARNPSHRAIYASHAYQIAVNGLSLRARRIVESERFRALFGVQLESDENTASVWATTKQGKFVAIGVGGALTGHRANECVVDDPLNSIDIHSKAARDTCSMWFGESFTTRVDNGSIVVVGQRLGTDDLHGRLKSSGAKWTVLTLPAEFDTRRRCTVLADDGTEVWTDPRTEDGDLLAPEILSRAQLDELKIAIGAAALESQYNENPSSDVTSSCPARWWRFYRGAHEPAGSRRPIGCVDHDDAPAAEQPSSFSAVVISADLTFGSAKGDWSVVQVWAAAGGARYLLRHFRARCGFDEQVAAIATFAEEFPGARIAIERAANGLAVADTLRKRFTSVMTMVPVGGKAQRLASVTPQIESGSVFLPEHASFTADVVDEFRAFGSARHDDIVDCGVWGLIALTKVEDRIDHVSPPMIGLITGAPTPSGSAVSTSCFSGGAVHHQYVTDWGPPKWPH